MRPRPTRDSRKVRHVLRPGDCFAWDSEGLDDGDIHWVEVLELRRSFAPREDHAGNSGGGYRVRVHCAEGKPGGVNDFYGWDSVDDGCVRLTGAQMDLARRAGWPAVRAFLAELVEAHRSPDDEKT
jgi:hypothetical protein